MIEEAVAGVAANVTRSMMAAVLPLGGDLAIALAPQTRQATASPWSFQVR